MKNLFLSFIAACFTLLACAQAPSISILGDSYSTFEGYVTPSTNEMWYYEQPGNRTDVDDVTQTWWWQVADQGGYRLCVNNSYSGSTIGYRGYDGNDYSEDFALTVKSGKLKLVNSNPGGMIILFR